MTSMQALGSWSSSWLLGQLEGHLVGLLHLLQEQLLHLALQPLLQEALALQVLLHLRREELLTALVSPSPSTLSRSHKGGYCS